jgi:hypothetical protein
MATDYPYARGGRIVYEIGRSHFSVLIFSVRVQFQVRVLKFVVQVRRSGSRTLKRALYGRAMSA